MSIDIEEQRHLERRVRASLHAVAAQAPPAPEFSPAELAVRRSDPRRARLALAVAAVVVCVIGLGWFLAVSNSDESVVSNRPSPPGREIALEGIDDPYRSLPPREGFLIRPGSLVGFELSDESAVLVYDTVFYSPGTGTAESLTCVGGGCAGPAVYADWAGVILERNPFGDPRQDRRYVVWARLPADIDHVRTTINGEEVWQRPQHGTVIFEIDGRESTPVLVAHDVAGREAARSDQRELIDAGDGAPDVDFSVASEVTDSTMRSCLTSAGASWPHSRTPVFAERSDAGPAWGACVTQARATVEAWVASGGPRDVVSWIETSGLPGEWRLTTNSFVQTAATGRQELQLGHIHDDSIDFAARVSVEPDPGPLPALDNEGPTGSLVTVQGVDGILFERPDLSTVVFDLDSTRVHIDGELQDILDIAAVVHLSDGRINAATVGGLEVLSRVESGRQYSEASQVWVDGEREFVIHLTSGRGDGLNLNSPGFHRRVQLRFGEAYLTDPPPTASAQSSISFQLEQWHINVIATGVSEEELIDLVQGLEIVLPDGHP